MRFEVFNLELNQGLESSYETGRDEDKFDATCHHLMVYDKTTRQVAGTYRLQTAEMAAAGQGFYSSTHFDLSTLPDSVLAESVEIGRASIAMNHRCLQVLYLLWCGLGLYLNSKSKRYLFGCAALRSEDRSLGNRIHNYMVKKGYMHPTLRVTPHPHLDCRGYGPSSLVATHNDLPPLLRSYFRLGAKICGPPAFDDEFRTIDYFTFVDPEELNEDTLSFFRYRP